MAFGVHWCQSPKNSHVNRKIYDLLSQALSKEKIRYDKPDQRMRVEPTDHGTYKLLTSPEQRISAKDVLCVLNDLGVGHYFEGAIPFRREPLWGPTIKDDEEVADEWWQADITKLNYSCLSAETRKAFQLAKHHCPFTF